MLKNGLILAAYSLVAGALLAFVYIKTAPIIEAREAAKSGTGVMVEVLPDIEGGFVESGDENFTYWTAYNDAGQKEVGGYVLIVQGIGYTKDTPVETMVGIDTDLKVVGVKVVNHKETPGIGDKIEQINPGENDPWYTRQFIGKGPDDNLAIVKDGGTIDAISGATFSSRAVANSIRNGLIALNGTLSGEDFVIPDDPEPMDPADKPVTMPDDATIAEVCPGMKAYELTDTEDKFPYWTAFKDAGKSNVGGYLFVAREEGFAGMIETLVAVDTDFTITGVKVLDHDETDDYGGLMEEIKDGDSKPWFQKQFVGTSVDDDVTIDDIDAISGATISSEAFTKSINNGLKHIKAVVSGEEFVVEEEEEEAIEVDPDEALEELFPMMLGGFELTEGDFSYWTGYTDLDQEEVGGYAFLAKGEGFASMVITLVATDADLAIVGSKVLHHEETDGWGSKVDDVKDGEDEPWFPAQFSGLTPDDTIALKDDGGAIDALTEATITSNAVTTSIANGMKNLSAVLSGEEVTVEDFSIDDEDEEETAVDIDPGDTVEELFSEAMAVEFTAGSNFSYYTAFSDPANIEVMGYAFIAEEEGFNDNVRTLVATDPDGVITGAVIIHHQETDGWGSKVTEIKDGEDTPWFTAQFIGKSAADIIALSADGGTIDALSEATITSNAVTKSIADGLKTLSAILNGEEVVVEEVSIDDTDDDEEEGEEEEAAVDINPDDAVEKLFPEAMAVEFTADSDLSYYTAFSDPANIEVMGYAFIAEEEGFNDNVRTLLATDPDGVITGAVIIHHQETDGWGSKVTEIKDGEDTPWFTNQFIGKSAADTIALTDDGGSIDALSEATITSNAVTKSIADGLKALASKIK